MKAVTVYPGKAQSAHLAEVPKPEVTDVPGGRGVLVRILRLGLDGTDKEINAGECRCADVQLLRRLADQARGQGLELTGEGGLLQQLTKVFLELYA